MTTAASTTKKSSAVVAEPTPALPVEPVPVSASGGFSITALVLGITGIVLGQALLSVGAIIFGFVARNKEPQSRIMANWGLVLGFVGVFGGFLFGLMGLAAFAPFWLFGSVGLWDVWSF